MILLSAQNIAKTYMERKVLDDVSFFLNEGDKVGIIGINGTGKSTLLRILAGAEEPDSGNVIRTNGIRISYLPQIPEFEPHGSVLEQVMLHLPADLKEAKTFEAKSILGKLGITDETRDISTLSGGEKRRAGIAAALIQPSDVLLLDEPTNCDLRGMRHCRGHAAARSHPLPDPCIPATCRCVPDAVSGRSWFCLQHPTVRPSRS